MLRTGRSLLFGALVALVPLAATAAVDVKFVEPEKYTDIRSNYGAGTSRKDVMAQLQREMEKLGAKHLRPGQDLKVEVLDIDLAGEIEWWHGTSDHIRVMRDITAPRMRVRYVLEENGMVVASGEERITDRTYLMDTPDRFNGNTLQYEKAMLGRWFKNRFAALKAP